MTEPWFVKYNASFVKTPGQNDAAPYGVWTEAIDGATVIVGGVHHLDQSENRGEHHIYFDVLNEKGERIHDAKIIRQLANGTSVIVALDKPDNEPGNCPLWAGEIVSARVVEINGKPVISDWVHGLRTDHPDEPPGNTRYHHSFLVVFQRGVITPVPTPTPTPTPTPIPDTELATRVATLEKALATEKATVTSLAKRTSAIEKALAATAKALTL